VVDLAVVTGEADLVEEMVVVVQVEAKAGVVPGAARAVVMVAERVEARVEVKEVVGMGLVRWWLKWMVHGLPTQPHQVLAKATRPGTKQASVKLLVLELHSSRSQPKPSH
jgi:hypothetical protein